MKKEFELAIVELVCIERNPSAPNSLTFLITSKEDGEKVYRKGLQDLFATREEVMENVYNSWLKSGKK